MIPSLGLGPVVILKGASERLQIYTLCGFRAVRGLRRTIPALAGEGLPDQPNSSLLSRGLGSGLPAPEPETQACGARGGRREARKVLWWAGNYRLWVRSLKFRR